MHLTKNLLTAACKEFTDENGARRLGDVKRRRVSRQFRRKSVKQKTENVSYWCGDEVCKRGIQLRGKWQWLV